MEKVLIGGNLASLTVLERLDYYGRLCDSLGLNAITRPFEYIVLDGKLTLYARKDCTDQLRHRDKVSIRLTKREIVDGVYIVTAEASANGRIDESTGAVAIDNLKGQAKANAMMKAETKAKRRVTLSFCGLGFLDESEIEDVQYPEANIPTDTIEASDLADMSDEKMEEIQAKLNATLVTNTLSAAEPIKTQTTIVDPAEKKPDPPKAEPPKTQAAAPAPSRTWAESVWVDICLYFADSPQLVELRDHILHGMKYVNKTTGRLNDLRQINAMGRDVFMRRVAIEAERRNITLGVK